MPIKLNFNKLMVTANIVYAMVYIWYMHAMEIVYPDIISPTGIRIPLKGKSYISIRNKVSAFKLEESCVT